MYLERAILKGLAVQRQDRFRTGGEFWKHLKVRKWWSCREGRGMARGQIPVSKASRASKPGEARPSPKSPSGSKIAAAAAAAAVAFAAVALIVSRNPPAGAGGEGGSGQDIAVQEDTQPEAPVPTVAIARGGVPGEPGRAGFIRKEPDGQRLDKSGADDGLKSLNLEKNPDISNLTVLAD